MCSVSDDSVSMRPATLHGLITMRVMFIMLLQGKLQAWYHPQTGLKQSYSATRSSSSFSVHSQS